MSNPFAINEIEGAAAPAQAPNPFSVSNIQSDQRTALRSTLSGALDVNPDQAAKAAKLAAQTGMPYGVVNANLPEVERSTTLSAYDSMISESPKAAKFLTVPQNAEIARDDVGTLKSIESAIKKMLDPSAYRSRERSTDKLSVLNNAELTRRIQEIKATNPGLDDDAARSLATQGVALDNVNPRMGASRRPEANATNLVVGTFTNAKEAMIQGDLGQSRFYADVLGLEGAAANYKKQADQSKSRQFLGVPEPDGWLAKNVYGGVNSTVQQLPGIAASIVMGNPAPVLASIFYSTSGSSYSKYRDRGATVGEATLGAGIEGGLEVATEYLPMKFLTEKIGKMGVGAFTKQYLGKDLAGEEVNTVLSNAVDTAIANPNKTWGQYFAELPEAMAATAVQTFVQSGLIGAAHTGLSKTIMSTQASEYRAQQADEQAKVFEGLQKTIEASKLLERSPDTLRTFMQEIADEGVPLLYVDSAALIAAGVDMQELAQALPSVAAQLEQAESGGDLVIPTGELLTDSVGSTFAQQLIEHARTSESAMSRAEAKVFMQEQGDQLNAEIEKVLEQRTNDTEFKEGRDQVQAQLLTQLNEVSRFTPTVNQQYATLAANFYAVMAARTGMTVKQFADTYKLDFAGQAGVGGQVLDQTTPEFKTFFGDSKVVDAQGRPLVVYHGTNEDFSSFDPDIEPLSWESDRGLQFFLDSAKGASYYAEGTQEAHGGNAVVMPVYLSMTSPRIETTDRSPSEYWDEQGASLVQFYPDADGFIIRGDGETMYVTKKPNQIKSAIGNNGKYDPTNPNILEQSMSSRLPGGKKATQDPLDSVLNITFDVALADPVSLGKNVAALQQLPNMRKLKGKGAKDDAKNVEAFIEHAVNNLLWLHDHMPAEMRERAHLWYDGGRKTIEAWANRYGISEMQGAAAIAVLSPQNGWFANVSQAERIADMVFGLRDTVWDDAMTAEAVRISEEGGLDDRMQQAVGKTLGELLATPDIAARWVRVYDQTHNSRAYRVLTPEGGAAGYVQTGKGVDATMMWKSYSTIAKAVSVLTDGRAENVYYQIGKEHKVRNFYNNLFAPNSDKGFATIDTHAVAAALLRPLASADIEVDQAFGGGGSSSSLATGLNGTYPIYLEAYRRAAEARGILPREMQSITWEAVRGLFEAAKKSGLKTPANAIWKRYKTGEIEQDQAQKEILELAGDITPPSWVNEPFNDQPSRTYEGPAQAVVDAQGDVGAAAPVAKTMFEVAPDPTDVELTAEWNALSSEERLAISQQVASVIVPKVLKELGTEGDFTMQLGGYLGSTNPSMTLRIARPELTIQVAKLLGHALAQDSMMVVSETKVIGAEAVGAVTIKLPEGYGEAQVSALYNKLWELERDGQKLVGGHTAADGQMVILNYSGLATEDFGQLIDAHLGGEFPVSGDQVYSAFPTKEDYGYGVQNESPGDTAPRKSPAQRRPDNLRAEATGLLREALNARRTASTYGQGEVDGQRSQQAGDRGGRPESRSLAPLEGAPSVPGFHGPDPRITAVADQYAADNGIDLRRQDTYVEIDVERATRLAQAYADMAHAPNDPAVKEAYQNLIQQTTAQYQALVDAGYKFYFIDLETPEGQEYASTPWNAMRDTRTNQRMGVFSTEAGFGTGDDFSPDANPLLADTGFEWPMGGEGGPTQKVLANDLFRAVHDAFGHGMEGAGFRAQGEENAWQAHSRLFTGSALGAITSETRGQNSWLNYGPNGETNRTAKVEDTTFADQKTGLMPGWTWTEGRAGDKPNILEQPARGQIAFGDDITKQASIVSMLKGADLSTFIHEGGHFFLEVQADLAARIEARIAQGEAVSEGERSISADMGKLLDWMGVKATPEMSALGEWLAMPMEQKRPYHETFARGFEAYAFEGNAPSLDLQKTFQTFRAWLVNVYRTLLKSINASKTDIGRALDVELTPEVRSVMDRMLATSDQIAEAEAARDMGPLFKTAEEAGMTADEYKAYHDQGVQATMDAVDELQAKGLKDMQWLQNARSRKLKELQKQHDTLRAGITMQVRGEVMAQPVYRAWTFLTAKGDNQVVPGVTPVDGLDTTQATGKLRTQVLRDMYGTADDALWRKVSELRMTSDEVGMHPDIVAELFDFSSGDELVRALAEAEPPKSVIEGMTDQRMLEENGDLASPAGLERAADMAIHNDARVRFVATELVALQKAMSVREKVPGQRNTVDVLARAAKDYASTIISRLKVRDVRPGQYTAAEVRSAKAAQKASGDLAQATLHKRNQLINMYAAKSAYAAQEEVKKAVEYFKKFDKVSKSLDPEYQDQIHALLERFDLRQAVSLKALDKRASLIEWVQSQTDQGLEPDIPPELLQEANRKSFKDMTVEEVRGLRDTIKQIEHIGRLKNKLLLARDQRDFDTVATAMAASIVANGGEVRPLELEGPNKVVDWFAGIKAMHRKMGSYFRQMDGLDDAGPMYDAIGRGMNEKGTAEDVMTEQATKALQALYAPLLKLRGGVSSYRSKIFIPEVNASLTRGGRLAVALNWGNEANRQRIMDGDGWSSGQAEAVIATLTPVELDFVNKVWEYLDSYWPEVAAKEKRLTGVEPEKVQAVPFIATAADGTQVQMRGGYYPLKYDANRSDRTAQQDAAQVAKEMMQGAFTRATTRRGHTKARVDTVNRAVRKDLDVITQHVSQVVHDLAWHEWLIDTNKLLGDKRVAGAIRDHYGPQVLKSMRDAVMGIATADVVPQTKIDDALLLLRSNVTRATMGASLTTAFLQPFGLTQSMVRIGPQHVLRGLARWGGDAARMESTIDWVRDKSDFMRLRSQTFNKELREIRGSVAGKSKAMQAVDGGLFYLMQKLQMVADVPTWVGQYEKSTAEGLDEAASVAMADRAVIESQGGGQTKDLAEVQRKHPLLTQFYSYFSVTLNLTIEQTAKTDFKNPRAVAGWLGDMALLSVIPSILPAMLMFLIKGGGEDEPAGWAKRIAEWQLGYLMGAVVGLRELTGALQGFDYAGPPVGRIVGDLAKVGTQAGQGEVDEPAVLALSQLLGTAFGIPIIQIMRSYKGWKAWDEGKEGAGPQSVLFGPPPRD